MPSETLARVAVVAGVLENARGEICLAQRPAKAHQGGLWEFPGGKREPGESRLAALQRELAEELGIQVEQARPLICIWHDYPDKAIELDVWRILAWRGEAWGKEGQPVRWVAKQDLRRLDFPAANQAIVRAVELPAVCLITPEPAQADFLQMLERSLRAGVRLVQLRAKRLAAPLYAELAQAAARLCHGYQARLLLNAPHITPEWVTALGADGWHLDSRALYAFQARPLTAELWLSAACHSPQDLQQARHLNTDFALLSPVLPTQSHPEAAPLGWDTFQHWTQRAHCPVYALGGMRPEHLITAQARGAQGIAAIRGLWQG